jgi:hypothetical protein
MTPPHRLLHPPGDAYQIGLDARELQCLYVSKQPTTRELVSQTLEGYADGIEEVFDYIAPRKQRDPDDAYPSPFGRQLAAVSIPLPFRRFTQYPSQVIGLTKMHAKGRRRPRSLENARSCPMAVIGVM